MGVSKRDFDFSGYATRNDLRCSDGRTIRSGAFVDNDGGTVPLVWQHGHNSPDNVLGHALLENRNDGVYCYAKFNNGEQAKTAKELVKHGDVDSLSIFANKLTQRGGDVLHGNIVEVSLVLSGAILELGLTTCLSSTPTARSRNSTKLSSLQVSSLVTLMRLKRTTLRRPMWLMRKLSRTFLTR